MESYDQVDPEEIIEKLKELIKILKQRTEKKWEIKKKE